MKNKKLSKSITFYLIFEFLDSILGFLNVCIKCNFDILWRKNSNIVNKVQFWHFVREDSNSENDTGDILTFE